MGEDLKLIEAIRKQTRPQHAAVEEKFNGLLNNVTDIKSYAFLLNVVYGFMNPLEKAVHANIDKTLIPDTEQRRNTALLLSDMERIGYPYAALEALADIDFVMDTYSAIGALYVMEGSALGGNIIAKMMKEKLKLTTGTAYFESNGLERSLLWKNFLAYLGNPQLLPHKDIVVSTAEKTFIAFGDWISEAKKQNHLHEF